MPSSTCLLCSGANRTLAIFFGASHFRTVRKPPSSCVLIPFSLGTWNLNATTRIDSSAKAMCDHRLRFYTRVLMLYRTLGRYGITRIIRQIAYITAPQLRSTLIISISCRCTSFAIAGVRVALSILIPLSAPPPPPIPLRAACPVPSRRLYVPHPHCVPELIASSCYILVHRHHPKNNTTLTYHIHIIASHRIASIRIQL
ncbi:hypothetical protein BJY52DRAFT_306570 [Lactarius psammicola]|nr:hypothetical protein BJY52DRAFT_306570 [Lactarius psammicola]